MTRPAASGGATDGEVVVHGGYRQTRIDADTVLVEELPVASQAADELVRETEALGLYEVASQDGDR